MFKTCVTILSVISLSLTACGKGEAPSPEILLNPSQSTIDYNDSFTLSWEARSVKYCIASGDWTGNLKSSGQKVLGPLTRDSLYILDCYHSGNKISKSVTVKVHAPQIPRISLSASPLSIAFGESTALSWSTEHVTECIANGDWSGSKPLNGTMQLGALESDSEFLLTCRGPKGEVSESINVDVAEAGIDVPRVTLTATPARISHNGSTTLSWETRNADICRASGNWFGSKARSGQETIRQLTEDSGFTLSCTIAGGKGGEGKDALRVRVDPPPVPQVTLTASPQNIKTNGSTTLRWSSSHAESCIATGEWSGTRSISGTRTISGLKGKSIFTLNCSGVGGMGSDSVTVTLTETDI